MSATALKAAFPALVDESTRLLVLGSLPGEQSLAARQYYANPTNQFWRLIGGVVGHDLAALGYRQRLSQLLAAGVGLWDVVGTARRTGSGDAAIRDHTPNRLGELAGTLPALRVIAFNGGKAAAIGRKQLGAGLAVALVTLPSSSAAYCAIPFEAKLAQWLALRSYMGGAGA